MGRRAAAVLAIILLPSQYSCSQSPKHHPAGNAAPSAAEIERAQLESDLRQAIQRERELVAQNPEVHQAETDYTQLSSYHDNELSKSSAQFARYLDSQQDERGDNSALAIYRRLRSAWQEVHIIDELQQPQREKVLKTVILASLQERPKVQQEMVAELKQHFPELADADLRDPEEFWRAYRRANVAAADKAIKRVRAVEKESEFPVYVLEHIRKLSLAHLELEAMYFPYAQLKTPEPLRKVRDQIHQLQIRIANLRLAKEHPGARGATTRTSTSGSQH